MNKTCANLRISMTTTRKISASKIGESSQSTVAFVHVKDDPVDSEGVRFSN